MKEGERVPAQRLPPLHQARGILLMVGSALCFSANVLLVRRVAEVDQVGLWTVSVARFAIGLVVVWTVFRSQFAPSHLFTRRKLAERGLLGGVSVVGYYFTVVHLGAGRATFINNTYVVWGALMAIPLLGETFRPILILSSAVALPGLALLTHAFHQPVGFEPYVAVALLFSLFSAYIVVTIRQLHATESTATIFAAQCAYGLLVCLAPACLQWHAITWTALGLIVLAAILAGAGQIMMTQGFADLPVAEGSLLQILVPVGVALGGVLFFHERYRPIEMAGAALILVGATLPGFFPAKRNHTSP